MWAVKSCPARGSWADRRPGQSGSYEWRTPRSRIFVDRCREDLAGRSAESFGFTDGIERSESCLLGPLQARFASAGAQPPDLVTTTNKAGGSGRAHGTGMQDSQHSTAYQWPTTTAAPAFSP